jgi:drug/metabolite transporter (DMT)-like permease
MRRDADGLVPDPGAGAGTPRGNGGADALRFAKAEPDARQREQGTPSALRLAARRRALLLMIVAPVLWSTAGVVTRWLTPVLRETGGFEITLWRSMFAALFVAGWLFMGHGGVRRVLACGRAGILSGVCWAVMFCCFMISLSFTTVANTLIVESIGPLLTALLARLVLRADIAPRTWLAIAAAGAGIGWMFAGAAGTATPGRHALGMAVALGIPLASAVNLVTLQRSRSHVDLIPAVLIGGVLSALAMLPLALPLSAGGGDIAWLAALGVFQLGLPCVMLVVASRALSAPELSLMALLEVVLGPLWTWLGAGEAPQSATLLGGGVVIAALVLNEVAGLRSTRAV